MNNRVLLLYYYYHHHQMVERMASSMSKYGIGVDVLCLDNLKLVKNTNQNYHFVTEFLHRLLLKQKTGIVFRVLRKVLLPIVLHSMIRQYDLIDFHAFSLDYISYIRFCVKKSIPFDITLWGSDIMRANEYAVSRKRYGFEHCRYIKASENVLAVVSEKYSGSFDNKFRCVYWGNADFEAIDSVMSSYPDIDSIKSSFVPEAVGKIIVTCGYNGSKSQNHFKIFEAIGRLPEVLLKRLYLLIPLTYGASEDYPHQIEMSLKSIHVPYSLYTNRLPIDDIAKIRLVSDVVVNMQDTDGFSGSLQDHLYCNNVLIIGEWLNYIAMDNVGMYYIKTSYETLTDKVAAVLSDLSVHKELSKNNHFKMKCLTSWEDVIPQWARTYNA